LRFDDELPVWSQAYRIRSAHLEANGPGVGAGRDYKVMFEFRSRTIRMEKKIDPGV
jgi:hypothetical protein